MRRLFRSVPLVLVCAVGCSPDNGTPALRYRGIGLDESTVPLEFAIRVSNDGDGPARVDQVTANVANKTLIRDPGSPVPPTFDFHVELLNEHREPLVPGKFVVIAPGSTVELPCRLTWYVAQDAPPMLAVISATFSVGDIQTKPLAFVMQSRRGALDAALAGDDPRRAAQVIKTLQSIPGRKSDAVLKIIRELGQSDGSGESAAANTTE